jgi:polyhydroxyalkanoate synthesis regulator phasin
MTLGTNATLEERLKYAPDEITTDEIAKVLDELAAWKELSSDEFDGPDDIKARLEELEEEVTLKDGEIGALEIENAKLKIEINNLENFVQELEDQLQERP